MSADPRIFEIALNRFFPLPLIGEKQSVWLGLSRVHIPLSIKLESFYGEMVTLRIESNQDEMMKLGHLDAQSRWVIPRIGWALGRKLSFVEPVKEELHGLNAYVRTPEGLYIGQPRVDHLEQGRLVYSHYELNGFRDQCISTPETIAGSTLEFGYFPSPER